MRSRSWKDGVLASLLPSNEVEAVKKIPIAISERYDFLVWHWDKNGLYTVKSRYGVALSLLEEKGGDEALSSFNPPKSFWRKFWSIPMVPKVINFLWKVVHNAVATKDALNRLFAPFVKLKLSQ